MYSVTVCSTERCTTLSARQNLIAERLQLYNVGSEMGQRV